MEALAWFSCYARKRMYFNRIKWTDISLIHGTEKSNYIELPNADNKVLPRKKIDDQDPKIYRCVSEKAKNIFKNKMVIASNILQEPNEYDVLFVTDSLFEALNEKVFENVIVRRATFPLKISIIGKSLQLIKFNQAKAPVILLSIGFDHIIHRMPINKISQDVNEMLKDIDKKPVNCYGTSIVQPISIVLITIPEIGEFKQEFKQFNNSLRETVTTFQSKRLQLYRWKLLDWAAMINKVSKMRKRTFDRRLRLLIESYDKMKEIPQNQNLPIKRERSKSAQSKSVNTEQENELEQNGIFIEKVIETHADSSHEDHEYIENDDL
uniref:Uncharacterized protein n=1 Tax=Acrobeloides nanus TaxID=290746 RepID=A0A914CX79_9BILA